METYLVKSFEEDFSTKTLRGKKKVTFQTLDNIIKTKTIRPNTKSFGQRRCLSVSILHENYTKTYRSQGIIFQTKNRPAYVLPFDLVLLSDAQKIVVQYYRIKNNLHIYYNHKLIDGYEKFVFKDIGQVVRKFASPRMAWKALEVFRIKNGYPALPRSKYRLVEYNETVFEKSVKIRPLALFGYQSKTRKLAKKYNLKYFKSAKAFYDRAIK